MHYLDSFCEIDPSNQRGGMGYVSKRFLSGEFIYQYINLIPEALEKQKINYNVDFDLFSKTKNDILNLPEISKVLEHYSEEGYFSLGDAIIFDKYVIHRSIKLAEGILNSRLAFAIRFVDINSKYDKFRADQLEYPKHQFNYEGSSDFNIIVCDKDKQRIVDSHLYTSNLHRRIIHGHK